MYWTTGLYSITINGIPSFQAPNPAGGVPQGTELTFPWFNDVQGELLNVAQSTGITPAINTPTQVMQGIKRVAGGNITTITASTTLTPDDAGLVLVSAAAGNVTVVLPPVASAAGIPLYFNLIRADATTNTVTVMSTGSDTLKPFGGNTGYIAPSGELEFVGDGSSTWRLIGAGPVKIPVSGTLEFYVSPTGSDANTGLSPSASVATIQRALTLASQTFNLAGASAQINLADGTYAGFSIDGGLLPAPVTLIGDTANPESCIISQATGNAISITRNARLSFSGVSVSATGTEESYYNVGSGLVATAGASATIGADVIFGTCSTNHIESWTGASISLLSPAPNEGTPYTIAGSAGIAHAYAAPGGYIAIADATITLTGTPNFGGGFVIADEGIVSCYGDTFVGSATGPRYQVSLNGVIQTNGAGPNYLPGNSAGSYTTGGEYA
jgi:hypothetical protein